MVNRKEPEHYITENQKIDILNYCYNYGYQRQDK